MIDLVCTGILGTSEYVETLRARLHKSGSRQGDCIISNRSRTPQGYPRLNIRFNGKKASVYTHRLAFWLHNPDIDIKGVCVCHTCDNPACINPAHLWAGTHKQNMHDRDAKGRNGRKGYASKSNLTENDVHAIRRMHKAGISQYQMAPLFGVTQSCISAVTRRISWRHL